LADLALRLGELAVLDRARAGPQALAAGGQERLTPGGDPPRRLARLPGVQIERLAPQQSQDDLLLAPNRPAHLALASGRALGALVLRHTDLLDSRHVDLLGLIGCPVGTGCGGR